MINLQENADLQALNSFGFASKAQYLVNVSSDEELLEAVQYAERHDLPFLVIGGGSNLILADFLPGLVVRLSSTGYRKVSEDEHSVLLEVEAGERWHHLVEQVIDEGWSGLENLALIPGTVGAAPVQNIGAYGVELKDRFESLTAFDRQKNMFVELIAEDCCFGYRDSVFKSVCPGRYIITRVRFRLAKCFNPIVGYSALTQQMGTGEVSARAVFDAVVAVRQSKLPDPAELGNAGSFFENPVIPQVQYDELKAQYPDVVAYPDRPGYIKLAAGWLIDQAGWKGYRAGAVGVYSKQALVLVNYGGGNASALMALAKDIRQSVSERYGVELMPEPRCYPA